MEKFPRTLATMGIIAAGGLGFVAYEVNQAAGTEQTQAVQYQDWADHPDHMPPQPPGEKPEPVQQRQAEYSQDAQDERHLAAADSRLVMTLGEVSGAFFAGSVGVIIFARPRREGGGVGSN